MDLKQLEYFVRVAELGSFTRASVALDIAQPALSRQIRLLEVELRQTLLLRNGRGATPTEAGKLLLEHSRGILHQVARAREDLGRVRGALAGHVAVGLPPSVARLLAVPLTRAFRKRMPDASLSISEGLSYHLQEWLTLGRLDIALLYNAHASPEIETTRVLEEPLFLVQRREPGASDSPITLTELADMPLVIPTRNNALRMDLENALAHIGKRVTPAMEIDGVTAILALVADGVGAAVLPINALAQLSDPERFIARPITQPDLVSVLYTATSTQRPATLTQQAVLEVIRAVIAETWPQG